MEYEIEVWYDQWEIKVGDSLRTKIAAGIEENDYLAVVLSEASIGSDWVQIELNAALAKELRERRVVVLPVLIQDCSIPTFLQDKKWADFRSNYGTGLEALLAVLDVKHRVAQRSSNLPHSTGHRNDELALNPRAFEDWFVDRIEASNQVRLKRHFWNWRDAVRGMQPVNAAEEVTARQLSLSPSDKELLRRIAVAGNVLIRYGQIDLFATVADILYDAYLMINDWGVSAGSSADFNIRSASARCELLDIVFSLGASAMDEQAYGFLRPLIDRRTLDRGGYWHRRGWFRYTLTMAARAEPNRREDWYVPIRRAAQYLQANDVLLRYFLSPERAADRICQFDLLQCIYWVLQSDAPDRLRESYPSCAFFGTERVESLVKALIDRQEPASLLGTYSNELLAEILLGFTAMARERGFLGHGGWADERWEDPAVREFLSKHASATT